MSDDRSQLARKQAAVLGMLRGSASPPPEFNSAHVETARLALLRKRTRGIEKAWPALAAALAPNLMSVVNSHTRATGNIQSGGPFAEGFALARWLDETGNLPTSIAPEFLRALLVFRLTPAGPVRRTGIRMCTAKTRAPTRILIGIAIGNVVRVFGTDSVPRRPVVPASRHYVE